LNERELSNRLRNAVAHCKEALEIKSTHDRSLKAGQKEGFERCLTENYLVKFGPNYFGKRDLIYVDLFGSEDVKNLYSSV